MEDKISSFVLKAKNSTEDHVTFAEFVSEAETFAVQNPTIFISDKSKDDYIHIWNELEIINALALNKWEEDGKPVNWFKEWASCFQIDAERLISELINLVEAV